MAVICLIFVIWEAHELRDTGRRLAWMQHINAVSSDIAKLTAAQAKEKLMTEKMLKEGRDSIPEPGSELLSIRREERRLYRRLNARIGGLLDETPSPALASDFRALTGRWEALERERKTLDRTRGTGRRDEWRTAMAGFSQALHQVRRSAVVGNDTLSRLHHANFSIAGNILSASGFVLREYELFSLAHAERRRLSVDELHELGQSREVIDHIMPALRAGLRPVTETAAANGEPAAFNPGFRQRYHKSHDNIRAALAQGPPFPAVITAWIRSHGELINEILAVADALGAHTHAQLDALRTSHERNYILFFLSIIASVFMIAAVSLFLRSKVLRPLGALNQAANRIANGDLQQSVSVRGRDELSELAESFERMRMNLEEDIARRQSLEKQLQQNEARMRAVLDAAAEGIITIDEQGVILSFNEAAACIFGYSAAQAVGENIKTLMPEPYRSEHDRYLNDYLRSGQARIIGTGPREVQAMRSGGEVFPAEIAISEMSKDDRKLFIGIVRDISGRKEIEWRLKEEKDEQIRLNERLMEMQQQLVQSEKMASIGQLSAGIAHEINNPIGYITSNLHVLEEQIRDVIELVNLYQVCEPAIAEKPGFADLLQSVREKTDLAHIREDMHDVISESQHGVDRVRKIVRDLKEFSCSGDQEWENADLCRGLESTLSIAYNEIKYRATVLKEYSELPPVYCVPSQINQVFMNLLVNAAYAVQENGTITIKTGKENDEWVWVKIMDNGAGIDPENISKLFDPFFTTKPVGEGTGLGLSVSYSIIERHRGRIEVASEPGTGSAFTVWLPMCRGTEKEVA